MSERRQWLDSSQRGRHGKEFQTRAAATGNARSPSVEPVDGMTRVGVAADRRWRRADMSEVRCTVSARYVKEVFIPHVMKELDTDIRIAIAWYVYKSNSLKNATREKRGCGTRCGVSSSTRIPGNWPGFLRDKENKQKLFRFFAEKCVCGPNVRPHQWTSRCRCSTTLSLLQEVYRHRKHSSSSISSIRTHRESHIPSKPHLGSVPSRQAICSHARWLGWEKCDGQWRVVWTTLPKAAKAFTTNCSAGSARRRASGTAGVTGQTCSALHWITVRLRWTVLWKLS